MSPSHAERARTLAASRRSGALATIARDPAGHPYASLVTTALFGGSPVLLISGLAEHTANLRADPRASLLLAEGGGDDPLALGRVTLLGTCRPVAGADAASRRETFLAAHPDAKQYVDFADFAFYELAVESARYVGGFGRMSWVSGADWYAAEPDPLVASAPAILEHMNQDHRDAMAAYCRAFSAEKEVEEVVMTGVDRYGIEMSVKTAEGRWRPVRLAFSGVADTPGAVRAELVALGARLEK